MNEVDDMEQAVEVGMPREEKEPLLHLAGISKRFTGVLALDRVDLDVRTGELHVLFGENGAGGVGRIGRFQNGAADHDVGRTGAGGVGRGHDAFLIVAAGFAGRADAGSDQLYGGGQCLAQHGNFER